MTSFFLQLLLPHHFIYDQGEMSIGQHLATHCIDLILSIHHAKPHPCKIALYSTNHTKGMTQDLLFPTTPIFIAPMLLLISSQQLHSTYFYFLFLFYNHCWMCSYFFFTLYFGLTSSANHPVHKVRQISFFGHISQYVRTLIITLPVEAAMS